MTIITFYDSPTYQHESEIDPNEKNIFLAGPILGATDWQAEAKRLIQWNAEFRFGPNDLPPINVWNPRRSEFTDLKDFNDSTFYEQVDWEHRHLAESRFNGVRLFWLCNKTFDMPHRNYALTTLFELGEAIGNHEGHIDNQYSVVGIEEGFTNKKYLHYTIANKTNAENVCTAETLDEIVYLAMLHLHLRWVEKQNG